VFKELYNPCHQAFLRYCRGLTGDPDDAMDLAGEAVLIVFENLERLRKKNSFKAYLYSVARRLQLQHYRRIRFRGVYDEKLAELLPDKGSIPDINHDSLAPSIYLLTRQERDNSIQDQSSTKVLFWVSPLDSIINEMPMDVAFDLCIPVRVADSKVSQEVRDYVFWVFPNERFFQCLPAEISNSLRKEFNYQKQRLIPEDIAKLERNAQVKTKTDLHGKSLDLKKSSNINQDKNNKTSRVQETETIPCNYYSNLCATLPGLDQVILYPNPASSRINVDMVIQNAKKIRFRVINLSGQVIIDNGHPKSYTSAGQYKHTIDIDQLTSGLYMLVMTDEQGAKITKRFIK